tara:strand:- start:817 stop:963 length:147 start_codon:yes stop_codon:yes gene_type:complete
MDTKNVIAAIALSSAVIVLYSLFLYLNKPQFRIKLKRKRLNKILIHQV